MFSCRVTLERHDAIVGEKLVVVRRKTETVDCYVLEGDRGEVGCLPHHGANVWVTGIAPSVHRKVRHISIGTLLRYQPTFWDRFFNWDRLILPDGLRVGLKHFAGFHFQRFPDVIPVARVELREERPQKAAQEAALVS